MFLEVKGVLNPGEVERLTEIAAKVRFVDGRMTNIANETKNNRQADMHTPEANEAAQLALNGLVRTREFRDYSFPKIIAPPMLARYDQPGMKYGAHYDAAFVTVANGQTLRSDVSATIFLSPPKSYEGGELVINHGTRSTAIKLEPGDAIFYPSTTLHEVAPVTSGVRLVAITFVQSLIADPLERHLLYELNEVAALEGLKMSWDNRMRLEGVRSNLLRRWSSV